MKRIMSSVFFCFLSTCAGAEIVIPKAVGCDHVSGECYIILESSYQNTNCTYKEQVRLDPDIKGSSAQYSTALAAFMAGKKLEVGSTGCFKDHVAPTWLYVIND